VPDFGLQEGGLVEQGVFQREIAEDSGTYG